MTILTSSEGDKPKEAKVLINPETTVKVDFKQAPRDASTKHQRQMHAAIGDLIQRRRRRHVAVNLAVAIASLLVIVAGICGGMYIYKWITYSSRSMQGSCSVPYHEERNQYAQALRRGRPVATDATVAPRDGRVRDWPSSGRFVEKYNVLGDDQEMLQVPQQPSADGFGLVPINIIHDFSAKLTAIVDVSSVRCYVKPLDPGVLPPRDFLDLQRRIADGSYVPNVCVIRRHYVAQQPALDAAGLAALGSDMIARSCMYATTYLLVRRDASTTVLPLAPTTPLPLPLLDDDTDDIDDDGVDDMDYADESDSDELADDEQLDPLLGGNDDPDSPSNADANANLITRTKRDAEEEDDEGEDVFSQINELQDSLAQQETTTADDDDVVFNFGFDGSNSVELALIHFEEPAAV